MRESTERQRTEIICVDRQPTAGTKDSMLPRRIGGGRLVVTDDNRLVILRPKGPLNRRK